MRYSQPTIDRVIDMRTKGYSIPEISSSLNIPKTTVLRHVRSVTIRPEFFKRWLSRQKTATIRKEKNLEIAQNFADILIKDLTTKDYALICSMLYWAEGSKKDFSLSNTDPILIKVFLECLKKLFLINDEEIKVSIRIYEDLDRDSCIEYWSSITGINLKNRVSINILKGSKKGKLQYGMCRLRIKRGNLVHKKLFAINQRIAQLICPHSSTDRTRDS